MLDYEIGGSTVLSTNDLVNLIGTDSTITFGANATLDLYMATGASIDPTGKTFVLFDYTGTNPTQPTWTINYGINHFRTSQPAPQQASPLDREGRTAVQLIRVPSLIGW